MTTEQKDAERDGLAELRMAQQAVIDQAVEIIDAYQETDEYAYVRLGMMQDLGTLIDAWRAVGGQTTDEVQS